MSWFCYKTSLVTVKENILHWVWIWSWQKKITIIHYSIFQSNIHVNSVTSSHGHFKDVKDLNKLGLDRSHHPELFKKEAVLKIFEKYPGAHPHRSSNLQKLYSTANIFLECFDDSLWIIYRGTAHALFKMSLREIFQCNIAKYSQN